MGSIREAAAGVAGLAASIQPEPPPKKPVENKVAEQPQADASADSPSTVFAARTGIDLTAFMRTQFDAIVDRSPNNQTVIRAEDGSFADRIAKDFAAAVKPSDIAGPLTFDPSKTLDSAIGFGRNVVEGGKIVFEAARRTVTDRVNSFNDVNDIEKLDEGDSIVIGGKGGVSYEVGVGEEIAMEIKCTKKDSVTKETEYTVSIEGAPEIGGSFGNFGGSVNGGGKTEYKFKSVEEVKRFEQITGKMVQCKVSLHDDISREDYEFLNQHVSSVEIKTATSAQYDGRVGIGDGIEVGVQPGVKVQNSVRIEYENGKPTNLVRVTEFSGSNVGRFGLKLVESKSGGESGGLSEINGKTIDAKGTITVETKIPLDKAELSDVPRIIADPAGFALTDKAETSVKFAGEVDGGQYGGQFELEVSKVSGSEARQIIEKTLQDKPEEAFKNVDSDVKTKVSVFEDKGTNINLDFKVGGFGFEYAARNERRDVTVIAQSESNDKTVSQQK